MIEKMETYPAQNEAPQFNFHSWRGLAWPIELGGQGRLGSEALLAFGPGEGEGHAVGVEEETLVAGLLGEEAVLGEVAIGGVANDGEAAFLTLDAELMAAAGVRLELNQGEHGLAGEDALLGHVADGGVALGCGGGGAEAALLVADVELIPPLLMAAAGHAEDEGGVFFLHLAPGKALADEGGEGGVKRDEKDAGGGGVEPVDEVGGLAIR